MIAPLAAPGSQLECRSPQLQGFTRCLPSPARPTKNCRASSRAVRAAASAARTQDLLVDATDAERGYSPPVQPAAISPDYVPHVADLCDQTCKVSGDHRMHGTHRLPNSVRRKQHVLEGALGMMGQPQAYAPPDLSLGKLSFVSAIAGRAHADQHGTVAAFGADGCWSSGWVSRQ